MERQGEAKMLANAIGTRCYGEDEFREHGKGTGGEQSKGKEERRRRVLLFIARKDASSFASSRQGHHGDGNVSPCEEAAKTVGCKQLGGEQERKERRRQLALRVLKEKNELRETDNSCMPMHGKQLCGAGQNPQERARRRRRQAGGGALLLKLIFKYLQNCH